MRSTGIPKYTRITFEGTDIPPILRIQILDIPVRSQTPILTYCRALLKQGEDPNTILKTYRGKVMCIKVNGIAKGARLTVKENKQGTPVFVRFKEFKKKLPDILEGV